MHLAGEKGYEFETKTDSLLAAMLIYRESSPIKVPLNRFFDSNEIALADMKRCAEEEKALNETKITY